MDASETLNNHKVIPVVVVDDISSALRLAEIFLGHELRCIEITLRTPNALACIESVVKEYPETITGAGSIVTPQQLRSAEAAGIHFAVSAGSSIELLQSVDSIPLVPGAATPSEVMNLKAHGYHTVKFFPAEIAGGIKAIRAISEPVKDVQFFPTGGIRENNLMEYLNFERVSCVGGSWLAPNGDVLEQRWDDIASRCRSLQTILSDL